MAIEDDILARVENIYDLLTDGLGTIYVSSIIIDNHSGTGLSIAGYDAIQLTTNDNGPSVNTGSGIKINSVSGDAVKIVSAAANGISVSGLRGVNIEANATEAIKLTGNTNALYATSTYDSAVKIDAGSGRLGMNVTGGVVLSGNPGNPALSLSCTGNSSLSMVSTSATAATCYMSSNYGPTLRLRNTGTTLSSDSLFIDALDGKSINITNRSSTEPTFYLSAMSGARALYINANSLDPSMEIYNFSGDGLKLNSGSGHPLSTYGQDGSLIQCTANYPALTIQSPSTALSLIGDSASGPGGYDVLQILSSNDGKCININSTAGKGVIVGSELDSVTLTSTSASGLVSHGLVYGATFSGDTKDIDADELDNTLKTTTLIDGTSVDNLLKYLLTMVNGRFVKDYPSTGDYTFYSRDNATELFTVHISSTERTRL